MAITKSSEFKQEEIDLARIAKALSHPARVRILQVLADLNICMCGDIVEHIPLSQSTVSQHLKELKNAGLIDGNIDPPKVCYCVNKNNFDKASKIFNNFFNKTTKVLKLKKGTC